MIKSPLIFFILLTTFLHSGTTLAFGIIIGKVTDIEGKPVPFVEIYVAEKGIGTTTTQDGRFSLRVDDADKIDLQFSHSAYKPTTITLPKGDHKSVHITLVPKVYPFEPIFVVGNLYAKESLTLPISHQILTIRNYPTIGNSIGDKLDRMGIQIKDYGGAAGLKTPASPTGYGEHILIMLDGLPLNSQQNGSFDFSILPATIFRQGEYYWGHGSSLYGSNAVGGVINLVTDQNFSPFIQVKTGDYDERGISGRGTFSYGSTQWALYGNIYENSGDFRENNDFSQKSIGIEASIPLGKMWRVNSFNLKTVTRRGISGSIQNPSPLARKTDQDNFYLLTFRGLSKFGQTEILLGNSHSREHYSNPDPDWSTESKHTNLSYYFRGVHRLTPYGLLQHNIIMDGSFHQINSDDAGKHKSAFHSIGWLGQLQLKSTVQITSTVRTEWNRKPKGSITTGSVSFLWKPKMKGVKSVRANWGTSYRNPTFNDLYWQDLWGSTGNPHLKPEIGSSEEVAFILTPLKSEALQLSLRGYRFLTNNLIQWIPREDWTYSPVNHGKTESSGITISVSYLSDKIPLLFRWISDQNESRIKSQGENHGKRLLYVPAISHWAELVWKIKLLQIHISYRFYGKRRFAYTNFYGVTQLKAYDRVDLSITYKGWVISKLKPIVNFGVRNLQNWKNQETVYGYPEPGRAIFTELMIEIP